MSVWHLNNQGHVKAQSIVGVCYYKATGVEKDECMGFKYLLMAADQGHTLAQHNVGWCYKNGRGVEKNECMAFK